MSTVVIALGGNALLVAGSEGTYEEQLARASVMAKDVAHLLDQGHRVVIVHGNGPQVGNLAVQQEASREHVPSQPLHSLVAMTQGQIGAMLSQALRDVLGDESPPVVTLLTHVVVDSSDPALSSPTKPIGPYLDADEEMRAHQRGWVVADDAGRGRRRLVPSPVPIQVQETGAVAALVERDFVVIAGGGGGIPLMREGGRLMPVDAVIDKDRTALELAKGVRAEVFTIVTDVDHLYLDYDTENERPIPRMTVDEGRGLIEEHQFAEGSMKPKVEAGIAFVDQGGECALITSPGSISAGLAGAAGTRIVGRDRE